MMNFINITFLILLLSLSSLSAHAGKIYRFKDQNGVSTLSKVLPPYAAQQGYDILDDKSLYLIEHIASQEQSIKDRQAQLIIEQQQLELQRKKDEERRLYQVERIKDQNIIARYPTIEILLKSRDADLQFRQRHIDDISQQLKNNELKLIKFQQDAADQELNGQTISENLTKHILATREEIEHNKLSLLQEKEDLEQTGQQFNSDLIRLSKLLDLMAKKP